MTTTAVYTVESPFRVVRAARLWAAGWYLGDAWRESASRVVVLEG